jgi:NAD(P)-dependent dehydrogenase (short-subunit alcohol dehydrogenase family)
MENKEFSIKNRVAIITGGGGMLGFYHALSLLEIGAKVILTDISIESLKKNKEGLKNINKNYDISIHKMDVTKEKEILKIKDKIISKQKGIDILINNASLNPDLKKNKIFYKNLLEEMPLNFWNNDIKVGLTGSFLCAKIFGKEMIKTKGNKVIINIASDLSVIAPDHRIYNKNKQKNFKPISYSVVKNGIIGLTKYLATYWLKKNIRCNALSPGGVYNNHPSYFVKKIKNLIPLNRMATKIEYMSAIKFLCSDASLYMNGHNLIMDGGRSIW